MTTLHRVWATARLPHLPDTVSSNCMLFLFRCLSVCLSVFLPFSFLSNFSASILFFLVTPCFSVSFSLSRSLSLPLSFSLSSLPQQPHLLPTTSPSSVLRASTSLPLRALPPSGQVLSLHSCYLPPSLFCLSCHPHTLYLPRRHVHIHQATVDLIG